MDSLPPHYFSAAGVWDAAHISLSGLDPIFVCQEINTIVRSKQAYQLVATHVGNNKESEAGSGQLQAAMTQDAEYSKDAWDLFA